MKYGDNEESNNKEGCYDKMIKDEIKGVIRVLDKK